MERFVYGLGIVDVAPLSLIGAAFLCFLATISHYFLGALFIRGGAFLRISAGLVFSAAAISIAASYFSAIAKPLIYSLIVFPFLYGCRREWVNGFELFSRREFLSYVKMFFILLCAYSLMVFVYLLSLSNDPSIFNGHQNYFSGISLELLRADYYSRLKIFDNYPLEWGKYHFFNGAITALPQIFLVEHDLITFMLAKICIILVLVAAICELSMKSKVEKYYFYAFGVGAAYVFTMLSHQLWWSIFTNAYSSIVLFILFLQLLNLERRGAAFFFLLCFGLSTSRSLLPAAFLASLLILDGLGFKFYELRKFSATNLVVAGGKVISNNLLLFFACLVVVAAIVVMIVSGQSISSPFVFGISNYFHRGWLSIMSPAITYDDVAMRNSGIGFLKPSTWWHLFWLTLLISILLNQRAKFDFSLTAQSAIGAYRKFSRKKFAIILVMLLAFAAILKIVYVKFVILYYFLPVLLALLLTAPKLRTYVAAFAVVSIAQIYFFNASIAIPNYAIIEWLVLFGLLNSITSASTINFRRIQFFIFGGIVLIVLVGIPLNPLRLFDLNPLDPATKDLGRVGYRSIYGDKNHPICFFQGSDADAALAAASGYRVFYSDRKSDIYSKSIHFGAPNQNDLDVINRSCR